MFRFLLVFLAMALAGGACAARAEDVLGAWMRDDGAVRIEFSPCGPAVCGDIAWLKNPKAKAKIGQRVFFDMARADQISWTGKAFSPEDGKTYSGKMVLSGKKLKTSGCVFGGLICKTVFWNRAG